MPVQIQQVLVAHPVGRVGRVGPVPVVGIDDAQDGPVGVVRHVGLPRREEHDLELVSTTIAAAIGAGDGLPEQVVHSRGVGHEAVSGFQQFLHHVCVFAETLALSVGAVVHVDGAAQELLDGVDDDAEVVALRREQSVGDLVGVEAVAVFGGDGAQQHGYGSRFSQVVAGFLGGAVVSDDVGVDGRVQLGEAWPVDHLVADAGDTQGGVVGMD